LADNAEPPKSTDPPGPVVRWVTVSREYDRDDRLLSERTTETRDTQLDHPEAPAPGFYL
jgi:hypothetical protein